MRRGHPALRWTAALLGVGVFAWLFHSTDRATLGAVLARSGPWMALALLPFLGLVLIDALGWLRLIGVLGPRPGYAALLRVRLSLEALTLTLPAGALISESTAPSLLHTRCALPLRDGVVAVAARRWLTLRAHAGYLLLGAAVGFGALQAASPRLIGRGGLGFVAIALPLIPLVLSLVLESTLSRGSLAHRLQHALARLPGRAGRWFASHRKDFDEVDDDFQRFGHGGRAALFATGAYLLMWALESAETWLILHLLGAHTPFLLVLAFEPPLSLLRSAAFFMPAGLGAQDLGYVAFLGSVAGPSVALAFVVVKRAKEAVWAAVGWGLLLSGKSAPAQGGSTVSP